ncbi:GNAT family N-acetyltransferase [Roseobacter ponti]|uniref:GNAT family N-acetyltransferase n=1 Tax=Roseobacter ponti TaxID=1891787 RepID=A0A858SN49_9RHOB|nr:GNAT family N-acetyltransferase [Roseobacter ponti]QJF50105.1 GNAT family N-acetyltransferase [Roseobacter ponti]
MTAIVRVRADEPDVAQLLTRHFELMRSQSPPESCHVLPGDALNAPDITLYGLRDADEVVAVGAIRKTGSGEMAHGELKSMHTAQERRGQGLARHLLRGMISEARSAGITVLNLETGAGEEHAAARRLYHSEGFRECPPFGEYVSDPLSVFMTRRI